MLTTQKGKSWFTKEMRKAKDKSLLGHGDKRQFTCLASTSAAGLMLPHSLVFAGKGSGSLVPPAVVPEDPQRARQGGRVPPSALGVGHDQAQVREEGAHEPELHLLGPA